MEARRRGAVVTVLSEALARRVSQLPPDTTCYRWLDHEIAGITVDRFGPVAVLSEYRECPEEDALADELLGTAGIESVYVKRRPREASKLGKQDSETLAPLLPLRGKAKEVLTAWEAGAQFEIRPGNGLSVGLYLDARDARVWVNANARGRRVLNTFAYTCGFGIAAKRGGAQRVANLDASRKVLDWGERNYALNDLEPDRYDFISGDTFDWLARLTKKGEEFDLVILDPPGFATTSSSRFRADRDYHRLVAAAQGLLGKGGLLLAMCNVEIDPRGFEEQLNRGLIGREARYVTRFGASSIDFRAGAPLKCCALELGVPAAPLLKAQKNAPR